ncbi:MAG: hypothetical protein NG737_06185 [Omnitrophica bacterium]|nr:hypothetical protein [Candidatus Omnitrophota bacterium]
MKKIISGLSLFLILSVIANNVYAGVIKGTVSASRLKSPKDILVHIERVEGKEFSVPKEPAKMDQISLVFVPRVLPILLGTTVAFYNADDLKHNVFGVGDYDFDLGTWGKGRVVPYTFDKLGEVAILCNVHPEMEAYIIVLQNPYFALTDEAGNYKIKNVPSGTYKIKTWHDRLKSVKKEVTSSTGEIIVDFNLKR